MSKQICKLQIIDTFGYGELKKVLDAIESLGYKISFTDNGNILIEKVIINPEPAEGEG